VFKESLQKNIIKELSVYQGSDIVLEKNMPQSIALFSSVAIGHRHPLTAFTTLMRVDGGHREFRKEKS